jgi:hypothetical protein
MSGNQGQSAAQWFEHAARCYIDKHQACPWCGGVHCVFRSRRPDRLEFWCSACDFFVCYSHLADRYFTAPGQTTSVAAG